MCIHFSWNIFEIDVSNQQIHILSTRTLFGTHFVYADYSHSKLFGKLRISQYYALALPFGM